ncbi:MAG TPA: nucleotidyltransferase family protein [Tardiphaga sp.]
MRTDEFLTAALRNPVHKALLDELDKRALCDAWIVAGSLTQTVWNALTGRAVEYGINDYDVFYFDSDLSWEAEDRVIAAFREVSDRLGGRIELRNQARVHLWYPQKHGTPYPALTRSTDGIDRFLTRCTQVGIRRNAEGHINVYAPAGLDDIAEMIVRPNPAANFSAAAYRIKAARWQALWPELAVLPAGEASEPSP